MKIEIKYFSSTGNTLWMARQAKEIFGRTGHEVRLSNVECDGMEYRDDSDLLGIFYPVWGSTMPDQIAYNVTRIKPTARRMFLIGNCALFTGDTGLYWRKRIEESVGADVFYVDHVVLPVNVNIPNFNFLKVPGAQKRDKIMAKALKRLTKICSEIDRGKVKRRGRNPLGIVGAKFQRAEYHAVLRNWIKTMDTDKESCSGCGICAKLCPVDNIAMQEGRVIFRHKCIFCLRCYNLCPTDALLVGEGTKDKERYKRYKGAYKSTVKELLADKGC